MTALFVALAVLAIAASVWREFHPGALRALLSRLGE